MFSIETKGIIYDRISLIKRLVDLKGEFKGLRYYDSSRNVHSYKHYAGLRNYLALTCFDILGQPDEWLNFDAWLISKKKKLERDTIFELYKDKADLDKIIEIHCAYNAIYGTKNSFYRFMRKVISEKNRQKLMDSIDVYNIVEESKTTNYDGSTDIVEEAQWYVDLDSKVKEKVLFLARNSFTHKGISLSDDSAGFDFGIYDREIPQIIDGKEVWNNEFLTEMRFDNKMLNFSSKRWPSVLIEIIEDTIKEHD